MTRFEDATRVHRVGEGRYTAELDSGYLIGDALNGGYLMSVMQRAVLDGTEHPHAVASSYNFLRPGAPGPAEIEVTVLKSGRTVTTARVNLSIGGALAVTGTLVAGRLEPDAAPVYSVEPPAIPPAEECARVDPRQGQPGVMEFMDRIDVSFAPASYALLSRPAPDAVPELHGHVAPSAGDGGHPADPVDFVPLAVDALPPVVSTLDGWSWAPTVELTWHLRALPAPGPLAFTSRANAVSDGWFDETVDLFDTKGRLVAQSRQLARVGR